MDRTTKPVVRTTKPVVRTTKPVVLRERARHDIDHAVDFYLNEGASAAAHRFVDELEQALNLLRRYPAAGSTRHAELLSVPGLRSRPVEGYPYLIFYREREAEVDVWRVLHERRDVPDLLRPASEEA